MTAVRIAVATKGFGQPIRESLRTAVDVGALGVQLDLRNELRTSEFGETGRRQFLRFLDELRLTVASVSFPTRRGLYEPDRLEHRVAAIKQTMDWAYQLRTPTVTIRAGRIPSDTESLQYQMLVDVLNDLVRHGNHVGAVLALTPMGDSVEVLTSLLPQITTGPISINFDPAAFVMGGHDPMKAYRELYGVIGHIQGRDAIRDIDGQGEETVLGRGEVEWDELLALIESSDYGGWLTVDRTDGDSKTQDIARAVRYLTNLIETR